MREILINGNRLEMYDSIDEMPITRFQQYNRYLLVDSGIGSDLNDFDRTTGLLLRYIAKGNSEQATKVLMNMRQNLHFVIEGVNPQMNAFVCLIKKMNGEKFEALSTEAIEKTIKELSRKGLTVGKLRGFLAHVKKKLTLNLRRFSLGKAKAEK